MSADEQLPHWNVIGRGLIGHCPRCGGGGLFVSPLDIREDCPSCGLHFEREEGYWLGSVTVIVFVVLVVFAVVSVGGIMAFWPDVPWVGVTVAGIVVNAAVPVLGYGWAKTAWLGINYGFHPPEAAEEADTIARHAARLVDPGPSGHPEDDDPR